jgi:hypothetical protein
MKLLVCLSLLPFLHSTRAHGDHGIKEGETVQQYARRHVRMIAWTDLGGLTGIFVWHMLDGFGAPYVRIRTSSLGLWKLIISANSDAFDLKSFFQLHDLNRCITLFITLVSCNLMPPFFQGRILGQRRDWGNLWRSPHLLSEEIKGTIYPRYIHSAV